MEIQSLFIQTNFWNEMFVQPRQEKRQELFTIEKNNGINFNILGFERFKIWKKKDKRTELFLFLKQI